MLLVLWAVTLVFGFALLHWSFGSHVFTANGQAGFFTDFYYSGTTFFTLGLGDISPINAAARALTVVEASLGFGLLALVIGYFPVLYQAFSRREVNISMLDARAGTPPTAAELLRRHQERQEGERDEADAEAGQPLDEAGRRDDDRADQPGERHGGGA